MYNYVYNQSLPNPFPLYQIKLHQPVTLPDPVPSTPAESSVSTEMMAK